MSVRGPNWLTSGAGGWLPTMQQVSDALQLHLPAAIGFDDIESILPQPRRGRAKILPFVPAPERVRGRMFYQEHRAFAFTF